MGDHAQFNLIAFNDTVTRTADPSFDERYESLWEAFNIILDLGLIYEVPYLFTSEGEIVFPLINPFTQEELPQLTQAFEERMPELYLSASCTHDYCLLVPRHMTSPEVKTLFIPKYRPHNQRYAEALDISEQRINQGICLYQREYQGVHQREDEREYQRAYQSTN
jgi:hypothetical protein